MRAAPAAHVRTAGAALLTELVAAHKEGLIVLPVFTASVPVAQKLGWLSSLGHGEFTRSQWEHMSKAQRRPHVLADVDLNALAALAEQLPDW